MMSKIEVKPMVWRWVVSSVVALVIVGPAEGRLGRVAYVGDSQTGAPGVPIIGAGLSCLDRENIIGFGNARATTYVGGGKCRLFGSFQGEPGNLCKTAPQKFRQILAREPQDIDTVVVALGDNPSERGFRRMLKAIVKSGKKCIWVKPARKYGKNINTNFARRRLSPIAEEICGAENIIDPSEDGTKFQTRESDHVHYLPSAGRQIARRICQKLEELSSEQESDSWSNLTRARAGAVE